MGESQTDKGIDNVSWGTKLIGYPEAFGNPDSVTNISKPIPYPKAFQI